MLRYFFHLQNGRQEPDLDGETLADDLSAANAAVRTLGEIIRDQHQWASEDGSITLTVEAEGRGPIMVLNARALHVSQA